MREQLIDANVAHLDAVLITHEHADHTHGIDDLRPIYMAMRRRLDIHVDAPTSEALRRKFGYIFETPPGSSYPPMAEERRIRAGEPIVVEGAGGPIEAMPFDLEHGDIGALGFRFGGLAYTPDLNGVPEASRRWLEGLDVWVVDALRYAPHPSHWSLDDALAGIETMRPRRAVLTNLAHRSRLRDAAQAPAARASSRPTTACASKDFESPCRRAALDRRRPRSDLRDGRARRRLTGRAKPRERP